MPVLLFSLLLLQHFGQSKSNEEVALVLGGLNPSDWLDSIDSIDAFIPGARGCEEAVKCFPQLPLIDAAGTYTGKDKDKEVTVTVYTIKLI